MDITNKTSAVAPWFRRIAALTAALMLAACAVDIDDSGAGESVTVVDEQSDALKSAQVEVSVESNELEQSSLKAGGGLGYDCTTECGGGGGCCTCYGTWDCILLGTSGRCKSGTFGCGGDGCMCDWKLAP